MYLSVFIFELQHKEIIKTQNGSSFGSLPNGRLLKKLAALTELFEVLLPLLSV